MKFTIEQIKNYILKQDSLGDVLYNLTESKILDANFDHNLECLICDEPKEHCICNPLNNNNNIIE